MGMDESYTGSGTRRFKVVQKLIAMRPVFEIYDADTGEQVAVARRTWLSVFRTTLHIEDMNGERILTAKGGFFDKTFWLLGAQEERIAKITRPWIAFRKNFTLYYRNETIKAQGGYMAWGFDAISETGQHKFRLDKKILSIRDQYLITVDESMDPLHAVALALVIDTVFFKAKGGCISPCSCICGFILLVLLAVGYILSGYYVPTP
ncbi:MAG: hypothetical protein ACTSYL_04200 [Candidatus Thorarchaeota archaeon]